MADELVVKYGKDGKVTVCFGEHCVVIECAGAEDDELPIPVYEHPSPPYRIQLRNEALADVLGEELDWTDMREGVRAAEFRGERIWRHRLNG
jgi:hypothetical protein